MIIASENTALGTPVRISLFDFVGDYLAVLRKDWSMNMQCTVVDPVDATFSLSGLCPHCSRDCVFSMVTSAAQAKISGSRYRVIAGMQCPGCLKYILGIVQRTQSDYQNWTYEAHYPLGRPNDDVSPEIPPAIAADFKEAIRCRWVDAYNATVEMCRRAIESSCIHLGADPKSVIQAQIDWVADQGYITSFLKDIAHKIRLGGNRGAHPPSDLTTAIAQKEADAVLEFTKHYFQRVYVMRAEMAKFDFSKSVSAGKPKA